MMEQLKDYYTDKTILLIGGTGLVGKILVEKVLRQLPAIRVIYVLVRPKARSGGSILSGDERLWQEIQGSEVFDLLRKQHGDAFPQIFREKVKAVSGDLSKENMGLERDTYLRLQREVQIIINCAAAVTFDAPIDVALELNTRGPRRLIEFARGCQDPVVAHVSTCYVNATREGPVLEEHLDPRQTVGHINGLSQKPYDVDEEVANITRRVDEIRKRYLGAERSWPLGQLAAKGWGRNRASNGRRGEEGGSRASAERMDRRLGEMGMRWAHSRGWHDVYTFTKAMGEQAFVRDLGDIRGAIIRPAIIESIWRSPQPGWLNGFRMLDPLIVAYGRGRMIDFPGNARGILDIIPVDLVASAIVAIIQKVHSGQGHLVYQIASGMDNPLTLQGFADLVDEYFRENPLTGQSSGDERSRPLRKPTFPSTKSFLRRLQYRYLLPIRAAESLTTAISFLPLGRRLRSGCKSKLTALERLRQYARLYGPYAESNCQFLTSNTKEVWESLSPDDQKDFNFDVSQLNWRSYLQENHIPGVKRYLLGMAVEAPWPAPQQRQTTEGTAVGDGGEERTGQAVTSEEKALAPQGAGPVLAGNNPGSREAPPKSSLISESSIVDIPNQEELDKWVSSSLVDRAVNKMAWASIGLAFRHWLGFECHGLENIPSKGPFIIAPNHISHVDAPAVFFALGDKTRGVHAAAAADYFFESRWLGWLVHSVFWAIPFDKREPVSDGLGVPLGILKMGHPLIFFPEGGRSRSGETQPFKSGIGILGLMSGAPVVPTHIQGTFQSMPKGHLFPKRHRVEVRFGPPILVDPYLVHLNSNGISEACRAFSSDVQKAVEALNGIG